MNRKHNKILAVPIDSLVENADSPNKMSKTRFNKLVRNIERCGLYEPIIVRQIKANDVKTPAQYEIINGRHRVKALKQLRYTSVDVCVWQVDDTQKDILLATLNTLSGTAILDKKLALLRSLSKKFTPKELAELLPLTSGQVERYRDLKPPVTTKKQGQHTFPEPLVFFVSQSQKKTVGDAIRHARHSIRGASQKKTKAQAIAMIAAKFMGTEQQRMSKNETQK